MTRTRAVPVLAALLTLLLAGCQSENVPLRTNGNTNAESKDERLVVQRAQRRVEVKELAPAVAAAHAAATDTGGYVESESRYSEREATVVIRVASSALDLTLARMAALGTEKSRSISSQDVTESHADLETRLRNPTALRDQLRALAARAKTVADVLSVETGLAHVQSEIESMQGELARLNRDVKLSALSVTFERTRIYGLLGYFFRAIGWGLERLFVIR
jgi:uncharacterized protein DUF4349